MVMHDTFYEKGQSYLAKHIDKRGYHFGYRPPQAAWDFKEALMEVDNEEFEMQYATREDAFLKRNLNSSLSFLSAEGADFETAFFAYTAAQLADFTRGVRDAMTMCNAYVVAKCDLLEAGAAYKEVAPAYEMLMIS